MASAVSPASLAEDSTMTSAITSSPAKKSWLEIRMAVRNSHRGANSVLNRVPHALTFEQTACGMRLYFLSVPIGHRENTIFYIDFSSDETVTVAKLPMATWCTLLDSFCPTTSIGLAQMSREEQLLRERKRQRSIGITSYDYQHSTDGGHFAFSAANSIYVCTDPHTQTPLQVNEVKTESINSRIDPKLCPSCPDLLAFVSGLDLWVTCISSGNECRLTHVHKGLKNLAADALSAGVPSFVVQEEFDRFTGYWWQPSSTSNEDNVFRILYEEVDESEVDILHIISPQTEGATCDQYRYPKAGTTNAKCVLKIVEFTVTEHGTICNVVERQLANVFPCMEYIVRVGWLSDGNRVYAEMLNRQQNRLQLVVFDVDCFVVNVDAAENMMQDARDSISTPGSVWIVKDETSNYWVNVHDLLYFFPSSDNQLSFIWGSAKSGFMHLYHVTVSLEPPVSETRCPDDTGFNDMSLHPRCKLASVISEVALTAGDWDVDCKQLWVDGHKQIVYFIGYKDTPLETHLYAVSVHRPGVVTRLTKPSFSHSITMDKSCQFFATVFSSVKMPTACEVYRLHVVTLPDTVSATCVSIIQQPSDVELWKPPELFEYTSISGFTMYGMMYTPVGLDTNKKYPVVLYVYAGPHVQLATNSYKAMRFLRLHTLASVGYVVIIIDGRGSSNRGVRFEAHIYSQMGRVEVEDQVEGLTWLASQYSFIDMDRIAIHGWSYGGYISLMGLVQRPDIFKVAIAGAPVTSWHLYDTGYTERYLDLPKVNSMAYTSGSVIEMVDKFPNEEGRLLIVHGLIDENVHFYHTSSLVEALVKACKPHQLQVYPNERHGIRSGEANEHFETVLISFLQKNL